MLPDQKAAPYARVYEYFAIRGIAQEHLTRVRAVIGTGAEVADLLGLSDKAHVRRWPEAVYLPGWRKDGTINPRYGHGIFFSSAGFGPSKRTRLVPSKTYHPNDIVWMPGGWGSYDSLRPGDTVVICESYVKAMVVSLVLGVPAIALNGVSGWSKGSGQLVDGLDDPVWHENELRTVILFDSLNRANPKSRTNVQQAEDTICGMLLSAHGAAARHSRNIRWVGVARLPEPDNQDLEDWGIDDFALAHGGDAAKQVILDAEERAISAVEATILAYNRRYVWLRNGNRVLDLVAAGSSYTKQNFLDNEAGAFVQAMQRNDAGNLVSKRLNQGKVWFESPRRNMAEKARWMPGEDKLLEPRPGHEHPDFNLWNGFAVQPSTDDGWRARVKKYYLDVVQEIFPEGHAHLLTAFASILQQPEKKQTLTVAMLGEKGTGKNYVLYPIQHALGSDAGHAPTISVENYASRFNSRKSAARLIIINELPKTVDSKLADVFESELKKDGDANEKYRPFEAKGKDETYIERNALAVVLSNFDPFWRIEYGERRLLALRSNPVMAQHDAISRPWGTKDSEWWGELWDWMTTSGPADVLAWALDKDLSGYDPEKAPPTTSELRRLMDKGEKGYRGFLGLLRRDADKVLSEWGVPASVGYFTSEQLLRLYKLRVNSEAVVDQKHYTTLGTEANVVFNQNPPDTSFLPRGGDKRINRKFWHLRGPVCDKGADRGTQYDTLEGWFSSVPPPL